MSSTTLHIFKSNALTIGELVRLLPEGTLRNIVVKPNWVIHASHSDFPIEALVTNSHLIGLVVDACFEKYPGLESLIVGDVPLQSCEFGRMCEQSGIDLLAASCHSKYGERIQFLDLRREHYVTREGFMELDESLSGDPSGYSEISLDGKSQLEEISHRSDTFRVSDYDPKETTSTHRAGHHRYLIARSVLLADLVINMPKMKTHQKSGITGALKNLVGINGSKAHLVHHQLGKPSQGGDEFPEDISLLIILQTRLRSLLQKRSAFLFRLLRRVWLLVKRLRGIQTVATRENLQRGGVYTASGSWYGNDSIWRMVYDLNIILLFGKPAGGQLAGTQQRQVLSILDAGIAGEGNGPLQALPVEVGLVAVSQNPFLIDFGMAKMMGFDWRKIPLLANYKRFIWDGFSDFDPNAFEVEIDGADEARGIDAIPTIKSFIPPPGWKAHIEL